MKIWFVKSCESLIFLWKVRFTSPTNILFISLWKVRFTKFHNFSQNFTTFHKIKWKFHNFSQNKMKISQLFTTFHKIKWKFHRFFVKFSFYFVKFWIFDFLIFCEKFVSQAPLIYFYKICETNFSQNSVKFCFVKLWICEIMNLWNKLFTK